MPDQLSQPDHDTLIQLKTLVEVIAQKQDSQHIDNVRNLSSLETRMEKVESRQTEFDIWRANLSGQQVTMARTAAVVGAVVSSVISSVASAVIVYFILHR